MDESGLEQTLCREYGRSPKGNKLMGEKTSKRTRRPSIIAGLRAGKPVAPMYFEGYCNTDVVKQWVKDVLIAVLIPGQVVIWDNASVHQAPKCQTAIEFAGCKLKYLPAYSTDFNPIEPWWAKLKAGIRRIRKAKMILTQALCQWFKMSKRISN